MIIEFPMFYLLCAKLQRGRGAGLAMPWSLGVYAFLCVRPPSVHRRTAVFCVGTQLFTMASPPLPTFSALLSAFCGSNHCFDLGWPHINVKCRQRLVAHPHWAGSLPPTPHHCALSFAFGCKPGGAHTPRLGSAIRMCEHLVLYVQGIRMHAEVAIRPECTPRWFRK